MNIIYKKDNKIEYRPEIIKGLKAYNKQFAGDSLSEAVNIYVFDNDKLVGGCHTEVEWNWLYIEELFYDKREIFITIMNELYKRYEGRIEGIMYESYIKDRIEDFKVAGYEILGTLEDKPMGYQSNILVNKEMNCLTVKHAYKLEVTNEKQEVYSKIIDEQVKDYNKRLNIDEEKVEIEYVAFDGQKLVGGVHGYILYDYLYVSILWVDEAYRGNDIATKLMDYIEDEAKEEGYKHSYLGTCTFQAKGFYEKRGYNVKMIISNCPKGYDDHTMVKSL